MSPNTKDQSKRQPSASVEYPKFIPSQIENGFHPMISNFDTGFTEQSFEDASQRVALNGDSGDENTYTSDRNMARDINSEYSPTIYSSHPRIEYGRRSYIPLHFKK